LSAGEDVEAIAERKTAALWGQWLLQEEEHSEAAGPTTSATEEATDSSQDGESSEEEGEAQILPVTSAAEVLPSRYVFRVLTTVRKWESSD